MTTLKTLKPRAYLSSQGAVGALINKEGRVEAVMFGGGGVIIRTKTYRNEYDAI